MLCERPVHNLRARGIGGSVLAWIEKSELMGHVQLGKMQALEKSEIRSRASFIYINDLEEG